MKAIQQLKINEIIPYENNPRINGASVDAIAKSIAEYGFLNPIILTPDKIIISGHTRWEAAKKLNLSHVPCIIADDLTEDQIKAFRIADNKVAENATWDYATLIEELKDVTDSGRDAMLLGFTSDVLANLLNNDTETLIADGETHPDAIPEADPDSEYGKTYALGNHRLRCGNRIDVLLSGAVPKLIWCENYDSIVDDLDYLNDILGCNTEENVLYLAFNHKDRMILAEILESVGIEHLEQILLLQQGEQPTGNFYRCVSKEILYGCADWKKHRWYGDKKQENVIEYEPVNGHLDTENLVKILLNSSAKGELILDCNSVFGSMLIASEQTGRICYAIAPDTESCDIARKRWAEFVHGEGCDWKTLTRSI